MTRRGKGPSSQRAWFAERGVPKTCNYGPDVHQAVPPAASQPPAGEWGCIRYLMQHELRSIFFFLPQTSFRV
ncbi:hypothetical protein WN51_06977 [Melipona quadrifasciata]|uniref:Uncharacterized protein n=1 Tax=Melipona quadrifasciata TaxID=166423 RepID=A0A0M8ZPZ4_9HYME|nr:hypothetical protein WN51_06977 [Melipona quadrifasciata]